MFPKSSDGGRVIFVLFDEVDGEASLVVPNCGVLCRLCTRLLLKCFFLGRGVANTPASDVCEDIPTKEYSLPNGERGVAGVLGVDGVSRSLPVSESSDNSSDWSGEGMISSWRAPVRNCSGDSYSSLDEANVARTFLHEMPLKRISVFRNIFIYSS